MTTRESKRRRAWRSGRRGEFLAGMWLMAKGYRIMARRYRTPVGEVDIVAARGGVIAFVEVKAHAGVRSALEAVTERQQRRIVRAAQVFMSRRRVPADRVVRFDVMVMVPGRWPYHLEGAFEGW